MTKDGAGFVAKRAPSELQAKIGELCIETGGPFTLSTFLSGNPGFGRNEQGGDAVGHVQGGWRPTIGPRQARV